MNYMSVLGNWDKRIIYQFFYLYSETHQNWANGTTSSSSTTSNSTNPIAADSTDSRSTASAPTTPNSTATSAPTFTTTEVFAKVD